MYASTTVHVRIDSNTKVRATEVLDGMGLSVSYGVRLFMQRVADGHPPLPINVPNTATRVAIDEQTRAVARDLTLPKNYLKTQRCLTPRCAGNGKTAEMHILNWIVDNNLHLVRVGVYFDLRPLHKSATDSSKTGKMLSGEFNS